MFSEKYSLWKKDQYSYPVMGSFIPNMVSYIHDEDNKVRPAVIVVPGGGYAMVSPTEGEIVALEFYNKGYNTFVVTYTTNLLMTEPLRLQPLRDLSKAVMVVRKKHEEFHVALDKIAICGFSAGGHLCGSLAVHHGIKELLIDGEYEGISNCPNAVILSYPVISTGEQAHRESFIALLGKDATKEELEFMSLDKQVKKDTPPVFLWHTATDELVPVENNYLFAEACKAQKVNFEQHIFGNGRHGLSLANKDWATNNFGGQYTLEQFLDTLEFLVNNKVELPPPFNMAGQLPEGVNIRDAILQGMSEFAPESQPDEGIAVWPILAHNWLKKVLNID
ncbi:alpha/beta hydrolase [Clostridium fungisolvens]|uniref:BD-FAE-like domain-containing protein n=1 Tax=Clostridium fungisolvens TaxID=1604897 RepID=A0A6V8SHS4_9CLOT|nr:alpha/beta hydrolase [Clostridium fungisolvens]GFP74678.1 hypothetical protein bsdtw1_00733 [Clostridium fungisolvens]